MTKVLGKKELESWLNSIMQERILVAPKRVDDLVLFTPVHSVDEIAFDFQNTTLSPKELFFPRTETLFTIVHKDGEIEFTPVTVDRETVLFGIRPCDARGIAILDGPYLSDPPDSLWAQHRDKTTLIGLACAKPAPQCFCTSMGSSPTDTSNVDILLTEVDDGYAVEIVTEKGEKLLQGAELKESDVKPSVPQCDASVPAEGIVDAVKRAFEDPYWSRLADRCIHCNICAYVCPTCYCFDIRDYKAGGKIERIRTWESCQSKGFSRIAGGYDPRANKGSRLRQRFCHKLLYFPEQFGPLGCVGCGRCVTACPVNIDIREIISDIQERGAQVGQRSN
ncbi:MAG TPA: sulfite reductase [Dehalococcoidia bacterium]|nr:sulfite reductase [Dehalococcoidia bacterium]